MIGNVKYSYHSSKRNMCSRKHATDKMPHTTHPIKHGQSRRHIRDTCMDVCTLGMCISVSVCQPLDDA